MNFNNAPVLVGDKVFDINRGYGNVIQVSEALFEVEFKTVRLFFDSDGIQKGKTFQTLFWEKPFVIPPRKNVEDTRIRNNRFEAVLKLVDSF